MEPEIIYEINLDLYKIKEPKNVNIAIRCSPDEKKMIARLVKRTGAKSASKLIMHLLHQIDKMESNSDNAEKIGVK